MSQSFLVIFDVDGTLVDSQDQIVAAMTDAFETTGCAVPDRASILSIVGLSLSEAMADLAPALPLERREALVANYRASYMARRKADPVGSASKLYPGARAALETLSGWPAAKLGVATGKARRGVDHLFDVHDLGGFFATTQTADNHPSKPHPAMLHAALEETGCLAQQAAMVGDTEFDMAMGKAAGMTTIGVTWGYHPAQRLVAAGADIMVESFGELATALGHFRGDMA